MQFPKNDKRNIPQYPYPVPIVRLIVPDSAGRVLLLKRQNTSYADGCWCLPGGKVDYGVTVEGACRQELIEETGLGVLDLTFLFYQDSLPPVPGTMHGINFYFECKTSGEIRLNDESSGFAWVEPATIVHYDLAFNNEQGLLRYWESGSSV